MCPNRQLQGRRDRYRLIKPLCLFRELADGSCGVTPHLKWNNHHSSIEVWPKQSSGGPGGLWQGQHEQSHSMRMNKLRLTTGQAGQRSHQSGCSSIGFGWGWSGDRSSWEPKTRQDNESCPESRQKERPETVEDTVRVKIPAGERVGDKAIYYTGPLRKDNWWATMGGDQAWHRQTYSTARAKVPGEGVRAVQAQPCTLLGLTGTKLSISEHNTTAVSKDTFTETY